MYVAIILSAGNSNAKYRSNTFLLINAFGDKSNVFDIYKINKRKHGDKETWILYTIF